MINGDTFTGVELGSFGESPGADVGGYQVDITRVLGNGAENYAFNLDPAGVLDVTPAPLELTAISQNKTYGDGEFTLAETEGAGFVITSGGLFNEDLVGRLPLRSDGSDVTAGADSFSIAQDGDAEGTGLSNYVISVKIPEEVTLTVEQRQVDVTVNVFSQSKVYGEEEYALAEEEDVNWTVTGEEAFVNGDGIDAVLLDSDGEEQRAMVGIYDIDASVLGRGLSNYLFSVNDSQSQLEVTQAPLTITPNDQSKFEGQSFTFGGTEFSVDGLRNAEDRVRSVDLFSVGADAGASSGDSPFDITALNPQGDRLENYAIDLTPRGTFTVTLPGAPPPGEENPSYYPVLPGLPSQGDPTIIGEDGNQLFGGSSQSATDGTTEAAAEAAGADDPARARSAQSLQVAETVLSLIDRASSELDAAVQACQDTDQTVTDFLGCVSSALDAFAEKLDPAVLDLPPELSNVSAAIVSARQGVDAARARASARLAGVTDPAARRQIELDAINEARGALQTAEAEVTKAITLIRADDPALASVYRAQANTVVAALNSVEVELQRAVGL